jgi:hypothetical protein
MGKVTTSVPSVSPRGTSQYLASPKWNGMYQSVPPRATAI